MHMVLWLTLRRFTWLDVLVVAASQQFTGWRLVTSLIVGFLVVAWIERFVRDISEQPAADQNGGE